LAAVIPEGESPPPQPDPQDRTVEERLSDLEAVIAVGLAGDDSKPDLTSTALAQRIANVEAAVRMLSGAIAGMSQYGRWAREQVRDMLPDA
jgi:hypothetical protein